MVNLTLSGLKLAEGAGYLPEKKCLEGTRIKELDDLRSWCFAGEPGKGARVKLVVAQAGFGKSSLAHSLAFELKVEKRLGGFFAFSKDRGAEHFFRTVARSLADLDENYASILAKAITSNSTLSTTPSLKLQFDKLLCEPLHAVSLLGQLGPVVIIVDALDECPLDSQRREIIEFLGKSIESFPPNIRFLVTSRPSEAESLRKHASTVQVFELGTACDFEVLAMVQDRLGSIDELNEHDFEVIAKKAEGIFQYAAVVCTEILEPHGHSYHEVFKRLTQLKAGLGRLDELYSSILTHALIVPSDKARTAVKLQKFKTIIGWVLFSFVRLTNQALVDIGSVTTSTDYDSTQVSVSDPNADDKKGRSIVSNLLKHLGALFSGASDTSIPVFPLHSSVRDFLLDESRSHEFYIGIEHKHHAKIATLCLKLMDRDLQFNMARLENSYLSNAQVLDFKERVQQGISQGLSYACAYFWQHLRTCSTTLDNRQLLHIILTTKFLFWIEVLALKKQTSFAEEACIFLNKELQVRENNSESKCVY
jgi:hypothetical protein